MSKINRRRKGWKLRIKLPPNRIIDPNTLYLRHKEKDRTKKEIYKVLEKNYEEELL